MVTVVDSILEVNEGETAVVCVKMDEYSTQPTTIKFPQALPISLHFHSAGSLCY